MDDDIFGITGGKGLEKSCSNSSIEFSIYSDSNKRETMSVISDDNDDEQGFLLRLNLQISKLNILTFCYLLIDNNAKRPKVEENSTKQPKLQDQIDRRRFELKKNFHSPINFSSSEQNRVLARKTRQRKKNFFEVTTVALKILYEMFTLIFRIVFAKASC